MATKLTQRDLRNQSGEVMRALDRGVSFLVTRNGVPVGELLPLRRPAFVSASAAVDGFAALPSLDAERLREDLDSHIDQAPEPGV